MDQLVSESCLPSSKAVSSKGSSPLPSLIDSSGGRWWRNKHMDLLWEQGPCVLAQAPVCFPICLHTPEALLGPLHPSPQEAEAGWSEHPFRHVSWCVVSLRCGGGRVTKGGDDSH